MKKIIAVAVAALITTQLSAQAGRIRITFFGFKCVRETWDDILGMDGHGDEVFFRFTISRADQKGNVKQNFERRTDVYGDRSGAFTNRIKAGTETPTGGIRAGDFVNTNMLLGEYDLDNGDITTVIPTAWEQDPIADNSNAFASTVGGYIGMLNQRIAPVMIGVHLLGGDFAGALFHGASLGMSATRPAGDQGELGRAGTRPIGMKKNGDFTPTVVCINTPNLVALCNSNYGYGKGVMEVSYDEPALGNARDHGIYSILLKFEFVSSAGGGPVAVSNPAPPPPSSNGVPPPRNATSASGSDVPPPPNTTPASSNGVPPPSNGAPAPTAGVPVNTMRTVGRPKNIDPNATVRNVNYAGIKVAAGRTYTLPSDLMASVWTGNRDGQLFGLKFNPPTAWILKDPVHGTVEAAGVCKVKDNVLTISYYYNNSQYIITSTYYDAATGELSGAWEKSGDATQKGAWTIRRMK